jgi:hypothetical protein
MPPQVDGQYSLVEIFPQIKSQIAAQLSLGAQITAFGLIGRLQCARFFIQSISQSILAQCVIEC